MRSLSAWSGNVTADTTRILPDQTMDGQPTMESNKTAIKRLLTPVTFLLVFFILSRTPVDADFWWHLRAGQAMWAEKSILLADTFSYTRHGAAWVNAFWLSDLLFYALYRLGGYFAVAVLVALTGAITFQLIYRRLSGSPFANTIIIILAAFTAAPIWGPRPQIVSFLLVALLDQWLNQRPRAKWILVPFFALWANLHGGWIWGFLLIFAHIAGLLVKLSVAPRQEKGELWQEARSLLAWLPLLALAIGINPNGPALWRLPFEQVNVSMQIQEWLSPDFHRIDFHPFLWMIFLLLLTAPLANKRPNWSQLFKMLGFTYLTFMAQRNIALFAIVAAPLLSTWSSEAIENIRGIPRSTPRAGLNARFAGALNAMILSLFSIAALANLFILAQPAQVDREYPVAAVEWIRRNQPEGRLFNSYNWGGFVVWRLPEYPVFIDGRADLYGNDTITQWQEVAEAREGAMSILDRWAVNLVLVEPGWPITGLLKDRGWKIAYEDTNSIVFTR